KLAALLDQDKEAQRRYAMARLAAMQKIGEIIADLEKRSLDHDETGRFSVLQTPGRTDVPLVATRGGTDFSSIASRPEVKKSKTEILKENRISISSANRYERLSGSREPELRRAVKKASQKYFSEQLANSKMPKA